jgi:hypothetical protein
MKRLRGFEFHIRLFVILLAAIMPLVLFLSQGHMFSISTYWETDMQPLFIITNAATSYYLYGIKRWRLSALFLLLLTAFSVSLFPNVHNFLAVLFFVVSLFPLYTTKLFRFCFWAYLVALPVMFFDMMIGESIAVFFLCLHHFLILMKLQR